MNTMTGCSKGDPSGIGGTAAIRPGYARVAQESAVTAFFFLFADFLAGPSGRTLVGWAVGMSEVRAAKSL